jgi:hypothetical protein
MSQSYVKACIFCHKKIRMSDKMGKWKPFNIEDHTEHDCKKKDGNVQEKLTNGHNEISLELVLKKLAAIGITLDLEKLKNA